MIKRLIPATLCALALAGCDYAKPVAPVAADDARKVVLVSSSLGYHSGGDYSPFITFNWVSLDGTTRGCAAKHFVSEENPLVVGARTYADLSEAKENRWPVEISSRGITEYGCLSMAGYKVFPMQATRHDITGTTDPVESRESNSRR